MNKVVLALCVTLAVIAIISQTQSARRTWSYSYRWHTRTRGGKRAVGYWDNNEAGGKCHWTGCVSNRLPAFCGAGIVESGKKQCPNPHEIDVKCCLGGGDGGAKVEPPVDSGNGGHNPTKGYWDPVDKRCSWTGCAPKGLAAFCGAATKESGQKQCDDPGRIDVKCCL